MNKPYQEINNMSERMTPNIQIGAAIKREAKKRDFTQHDLAKLWGCNQSQVSRILAGKFEIKASLLQKTAKKFKTSINNLYL